jgi:hypothetical protein
MINERSNLGNNPIKFNLNFSVLHRPGQNGINIGLVGKAFYYDHASLKLND